MADSVDKAAATDYSHGEPQNEIIENSGDKIKHFNIDSGTSKAKQGLADALEEHGGRRVGPTANELDAIKATKDALEARDGKVINAFYVVNDDESPCRLTGDTLEMNRNHERVKELNDILGRGETGSGLNLAVALFADHALKNPLKPNEPNKAVWKKWAKRLACYVVCQATRTALNVIVPTCGDDDDDTGL